MRLRDMPRAVALLGAVGVGLSGAAEQRVYMGLDRELALHHELAARGATAAEEEIDRGLAARAVELLREGQWADGVAATDEAWQTWRRVYGGRARPQITRAGVLQPPFEPGVIYVRRPSPAALEGAEQILASLDEAVDAELAEALLGVRTPGLEAHANAAVMRIGLELCRSDRPVEGILLAARARERLLLPRPRDLPPMLLRREAWAAPLLTEREPERPQNTVVNEFLEVLEQMDADDLAEAYRILAVRDTSSRVLSDLLSASIRPSREKRSMAVVIEAISGPRVEMRLHAVHALNSRHAYGWDLDAAAQLLRTRLEDVDGEVRYAAGMALLHQRDEAGLPAVVGRPADALGNLSLERIGQIGARSATPWLIEIGRTGEPWQRQDVVRTLSMLGDPAAVEFLGGVLLNEQERPLTRELAAAALGRTMDDRAFPYMVRALERAEGQLAERIIAAMTEVRPELSFPVLVRSMEQQGILDGQPTTGRDLGIAWLRLHYCSGHRDVVWQYHRDPEALKAGMQEYWEGRRALHEAARQVQYYRFLHPDPQREAQARRHLEEVRQRVPARSLREWHGPTLPPERTPGDRVDDQAVQ